MTVINPGIKPPLTERITSYLSRSQRLGLVVGSSGVFCWLIVYFINGFTSGQWGLQPLAPTENPLIIIPEMIFLLTGVLLMVFGIRAILDN
jgi:hypothetical protein